MFPKLLCFLLLAIPFVEGTNARTMRVFAKKNISSSAAITSLPVPTLGSLHKKYNLPSNASECEVLLRVAASSVNPSDIHPSVALFPAILGSDVSGTVIDVGEGCLRLHVGDQVWGDIGANTLAKGLGVKTKELGAYAEYAVALESQLAVIPSTWSLEEAGALPKVALTSYKALVQFAGALTEPLWQRSPTVLVLGGSGGTGTTGILLARALGAGTILTTTSAANAAYCLQLGANHTIDYHSSDWWDTAVIADNSVDVIYDTVGETGTGDRAMTKIRSGGHYVTITGSLASKVKAGVTQSMFINSDSNLDSFELLDALSKLGEEGKLHMKRIDGVFALKDTAKAFEVSTAGHVVGKLSIVVANSVGRAEE